MRRKALFANLESSGNDEGHSEQVASHEHGSQRRELEAARAARPRTRPSWPPEFLKGQAAAPVGALGAVPERVQGEIGSRRRNRTTVSGRASGGRTRSRVVDPSFVLDRMATTTEAHSKLVEAIQEHGQQVPILVRPHPVRRAVIKWPTDTEESRRRRTRRTVRAVVKVLTDEELVVAQGQENNERQDLSFIERSRFARCLEERGFRRDTIMTALSVYKSDLSNMFSVIAKIPEDVIEAIGPAPAIGRRGGSIWRSSFRSGDK